MRKCWTEVEILLLFSMLYSSFWTVGFATSTCLVEDDKVTAT